MVTRRELVTGGALGAMATAAGLTGPENEAASATAQQEVDNAALRRIAQETAQIDRTLNSAFASNTLAYGYIPKLREAYTLYWRTNGKFPEFCDIGTDVFYDIYDWHIRQRLDVPVTRMADGRMAIRFMFTQLIVRVEQSPSHIGIPTDRQ
jgi:hypothetical protein